MKKIIILLIIITTCIGCEKLDKRKVIDDPKSASEVKKEVKTIEIADLPFLIDSTNYMIHPIGNYMPQKSRTKYEGSSGSYYEIDNTYTNYSRDRISGNISNVKFQHLDSSGLKSLTTKIINIQSMNFLREIYKTSDIGYFLYEVTDKDTNSDGKLNFRDLKSLYISNLNGTNFRKISPDSQDLIKWKTIVIAHKLFFKSIEDVDNNGEFNKKDKTHYFYLDLSVPDSQVVEYFPI